MIVQEETWQQIPLLHVYDESFNAHTPVVIFLHGFTSAKEHNLHYAYQLVKKGIRVILPDAYLHGVRDENLSEHKLSLRFWEIVIQTIKEVQTIYNELKERKLIIHKNIALTGTSMGGIATCGCLKKYDWINGAAVLMGAPAYNDYANAQLTHFEKAGAKLPFTDEEKEQLHKMLSQYDLSESPKRLKNRPVLFWHGEKDSIVPFENSFNFYSKIRPYYESTPERLTFIAEPNEGHKVPRKGVLQVTDWLAQHLVNENDF